MCRKAIAALVMMPITFTLASGLAQAQTPTHSTTQIDQQLREAVERKDVPGIVALVFVAAVGDEAEISAARQLRLLRGDGHGADVVLAHQSDGLGLEHARAVELPAIEQHAHETAVVAFERATYQLADIQ